MFVNLIPNHGLLGLTLIYIISDLFIVGIINAGLFPTLPLILSFSRVLDVIIDASYPLLNHLIISISTTTTTTTTPTIGYYLSFTTTGKHKKKSLPERDDMTLCADFAQFFQDKVKKIIDHLPNCLPISSDQILAYPHHWSYFESPSPSFILHLIQ